MYFPSIHCTVVMQLQDMSWPTRGGCAAVIVWVMPQSCVTEDSEIQSWYRLCAVDSSLHGACGVGGASHGVWRKVRNLGPRIKIGAR